ncbi:MAG: hypothetical protein MJ211_14000 [Bacteroidales bacterium]|nr:hypothetical protein [Bacteroidales bacterium]
MKIKEIVAFISLFVLIVLLGVNIYKTESVSKVEIPDAKKEVPTEMDFVSVTKPSSGYVELIDTIVNSVPMYI